jgi:hypothetical protein
MEKCAEECRPDFRGLWLVERVELPFMRDYRFRSAAC